MCPLEKIIEAVGLEIGSHEKHPFSVLFKPESSIALHPHVDDSANGAFDSATAKRNVLGLEGGVLHSLAVLVEVVAVFPDCFGMSSDTELVNTRQHCLNVSLK